MINECVKEVVDEGVNKIEVRILHLELYKLVAEDLEDILIISYHKQESLESFSCDIPELWCQIRGEYSLKLNFGIIIANLLAFLVINVLLLS